MVSITPQPLYPEGKALGKEWVCESVPLLSLTSELWDLNSLINPLNAELNPICHLLALSRAHHILHVSRIRVKGHCTRSGKLHGLLPFFQITASLACGRRTRSLDMAGSCENNAEAVADSVQWVVAEIWGWQGITILTTKKKKTLQFT